MILLFQGGREEIGPDLDLVADVIEHIDKCGEPGNSQQQPCCEISIKHLFLNSFSQCFRCSLVFPPWLAGHQGRPRETRGEATFFLGLTDDLTMLVKTHSSTQS